MLYFLYLWLRGTEAVRFLNFLKYPSFRILAAGVASLLLGMLVGPQLITRLRFTQHGQSNVREDTPQTHQKKRGTPTMGGVLILFCITISTILFCDLRSRAVGAVLVITLSYGLIGYVDDWLKLSKRNSKGLSWKLKIVLQSLFYFASVLIFLCDWTHPDGGLVPTLLMDTHITLPFVPTHRFHPNLGFFYSVFAWLVVVATSNAVNLTDGLDGLAIVPSIVAATTFAVLCYVAGTSIHLAEMVESGGLQRLVGVPLWKYLGTPQVPGGAELAVFCATLVGAGVSFLWFNTYPASVFMGDVGSLALGGALGALAVLSKNEFASLIIHGVFAVEFASVLIQVASFKTTGKRVFRMAPVHHHFELKGWAEPKIIVRFWIISILCGGVALLSLKLR